MLARRPSLIFYERMLLRHFTRTRFRRAALSALLAVGGAGGSLLAQPAPQVEPDTRAARKATPAAHEQPLPFEVGVPVQLAVRGDRPLFVLHAAADNDRPIVYLHGLCGDVHAVESWKAAASAQGTLIALLGDRACGGGRFRWGKRLEGIEARIERALSVVQKARGGRLDAKKLVLFGYSQGAARAEALAARNPERYARVVLGGPPHEPMLAHLARAEAVAVFGGELESTEHMRAGAEAIRAAGKPVEFFLLPSARHGEYGPEGNRVMTELLAWLLPAEPAEPPSPLDASALQAGAPQSE